MCRVDPQLCALAWPGAVEFTSFLPSNMQSVLVQPLGDEGVLVLGSDYQRGFGRVDQVSKSATGCFWTGV